MLSTGGVLQLSTVDRAASVSSSTSGGKVSYLKDLAPGLSPLEEHHQLRRVLTNMRTALREWRGNGIKDSTIVEDLLSLEGRLQRVSMELFPKGNDCFAKILKRTEQRVVQRLVVECNCSYNSLEKSVPSPTKAWVYSAMKQQDREKVENHSAFIDVFVDEAHHFAFPAVAKRLYGSNAQPAGQYPVLAAWFTAALDMTQNRNTGIVLWIFCFH